MDCSIKVTGCSIGVTDFSIRLYQFLKVEPSKIGVGASAPLALPYATSMTYSANSRITMVV